LPFPLKPTAPASSASSRKTGHSQKLMARASPQLHQR
jgi:hypothetical protein